MDTVFSYMGTIVHNLLSVSWQVSILIGIIWIISLVGRRLSSEFRYWLWFIVLIRLCIPVGLSFPVGIELNPDRIVKHYTNSIPLIYLNFKESGDIPTAANLTTSPHGPVNNTTIEEKAANNPRLTGNAITTLIWIFGVLIIGSVILWRILRLRNQLKKCPSIERPDLLTYLNSLSKDIGINRHVQLHYMEIDTISGPAVSGGFRPRIYLPRSLADTWPLDELEPVLLHELAHIKRFDAVVNWIQIVVQVFYFFHPLVWVANRETRRLREEVCDDMAIQFCGFETERYSRSIINVIKNIGREPAFGFIGSGFIERKKSLKERIGRIMSDKYRLYSKMTVPSVAVLMFIGIISITLAGSKSPSEYLIEKARYGDSMIHTAKGKLIYIENAPDTTSAYFKYVKEKVERYNAEHSGGSVKINTTQELHVINYLYDRDTGKQRYDMENKTKGTSFVKLIKSYDGEKTTMITYQIREGLLIPEAAIYYEPFESPFKTPFYYGYYLYRKDISGMLATNTLDYGKQVIKDIEYVKSETVRNIPADVFSGMDKTGTSFTVWLAKGYLYRPVKIVLDTEGVWGSETYIDYKKTGDNIYLPDKVEHNIYMFIDGKKEYAQGVTMDYVLDETTINVSIDPDEFIVEIPEGIEVHGLNSGN